MKKKLLKIVMSTMLASSGLFFNSVYAAWWYSPSCGSTIEPTCLASIKSCHSNDIFTNVRSVTNFDIYSINSYTPSSMDVTADMYSISGKVQYYNQHMTCGWVGAACTAEASYNPDTESCSQSTAKFYLAKQDKVNNITDAQQCDNETGASSPSTYTPNPINTTDGNKTRQETDFNASGISPLKFTRYYSSNKNKDTTVGTNWRHSYTASLTENIYSTATPYVAGDSNFSSLNSSAQLACESGWNDIKATYSDTAFTTSTATYVNNTCSIQDSNGNALGSIAVRDNAQGGTVPNPPQDTVVIERANGNVISFTKVNSVWTAPSNNDVQLIQTTTGYTLTTAQDTVEVYSLKGQLVSTTTRNGLQQTLSYNATTNLLETVSDSLGNTLSFAYVGNQLTTVTLPDLSQLTYAYDANNNFSRVTREDNTIKTYVYEDSRYPNALTGIIDENNQRYMTFSYDALGRATTSELGDGTTFTAEKVTVNFIDDVTSTVTDALGQLRTYRFTTINGEKRLTNIEGAPCASCGGQATQTTYDANGYVATSTDFNGNVTTYINNARGLATTRTLATGTVDERVITTTWHATYPLPLSISQPGKVTDFVYDGQGNLLTRTDTDTTNNKTRTVTYSYNTVGQVLSVDGARTDVNDITTYTYDTKGNLATVTNALGHITTLTAYDARNKPLTFVDANGLTTKLAYDARGRIISRTLTENGNTLTTTFTYDGVGNLKTINLSDGQSLSYDYDVAHRLIGMSDQLGNRIDYTLDASGNRLSENVTDATNTLVRTRSHVFNMLSQLTQSLGAQNQTTQFGYDLNGNPTVTTDAANATTTTAFDALNRVIAVTDPLAGVATYGYDNQGNLVSIKDKNGQITTYGYDGFNNRIRQQSNDTGLTTYTYDTAGNVLTQTDAKVQTTAYQYDVLNRLSQTTYADGTIVAYSYDQGVNQLGRLTAINTTSTTNGASGLIYVYDLLGRMTTKTQTVNAIALSTLYTYDAQGRMSSMTMPSNSVVTYTYLNGQLNGLDVDGQSLLSNISYEAFGSINGWTWGNGTSHVRGFDLDGQLISQSLANDTRSLSYDVKGNITNINDTQMTQVLGYDALNRLTAANDATFNQTFVYDANGNRLSFSDNTIADSYAYYTINTNRLTGITGTTTKSYQYDANGNILNDGVHAYGYDARNRLVNVDTTATYQHNALGQRIQKTVNGNSTLFYYNAQGQLIAEATDTGFVTKEVLYLGNQPIAVNTFTPPNTTQFTINTVDETGNTVTWDIDTTQHTVILTAPAENLVGSYTVALSDWWEDIDSGQATRKTAFSFTTTDGRFVAGLLTHEGSTLTGRFMIYSQPVAAQYGGNFEFTGINNTTLNGTEKVSNTPATLNWDATQSALSLTEYSGAMTGSFPIATDDVFNMTTVNGNATFLLYRDDVQQKLLSALLMENGGFVSANAFAQIGDIRLAEYNGSVTNEKQVTLSYIHTDHLGTPRVITDANNTTLWFWHSDPFGKTLPNEDVDGDGVKFTFNLRYAGQYYDSETGLHYNYFRDYDPSTGRYVQSDPIGLAGGLNTYGYVGGNPLYYVDPLGLQAPFGRLGNKLHRNLGPPVRFNLPSRLRGPSSPKPVNLPASKSMKVDMNHIQSGHMQGGVRVSPNKSMFPQNMNSKQVESSIRSAYKNCKKVTTQGDRIKVRGTSKDNMTIEMWINTRTRIIETAYPF